MKFTDKEIELLLIRAADYMDSEQVSLLGPIMKKYVIPFAETMSDLSDAELKAELRRLAIDLLIDTVREMRPEITEAQAVDLANERHITATTHLMTVGIGLLLHFEMWLFQTELMATEESKNLDVEILKLLGETKGED